MTGRGGRRADRGQASTIGVVLVLAMTLVGATVALGFGATALNESRLQAQEAGIENALAQFDSRLTLVALGGAPTQRVDLGAAGSGSFRVDDDAGWLAVEHHDHDGGGATEVVYNESLGAVVYERDDSTVGYQGGGVWATSDNGSRMVTPPEFHYRSTTLTLVVMRLDGTDSVGGSDVTATVSRDALSRQVYPNASATYDTTGAPYANPIQSGNVTVTVGSAFYEAWAAYFRTRTAGEVTVDHAAGTVSVKLLSTGTVGDFEMPANGNAIDITGLPEGHALESFNVTIRPDDTDSANFANLQWSLYAKQGPQEFELHLRNGGPNDDGATPCTERDVDATVYYSGSNGNPYHGWHEDGAFRTGCRDFDGDGDHETYLEANLTGSTAFEYTSLKDKHLEHFSPSGSLETTASFSEHGDDGVAWESPPATFSSGDETTLGNLTAHYLGLMGPDVELTVEDKNSDTVNEDASSGYLEYVDDGGMFVKFLHIAENRVTIELE